MEDCRLTWSHEEIVLKGGPDLPPEVLRGNMTLCRNGLNNQRGWCCLSTCSSLSGLRHCGNAAPGFEWQQTYHKSSDSQLGCEMPLPDNRRDRCCLKPLERELGRFIGDAQCPRYGDILSEVFAKLDTDIRHGSDELISTKEVMDHSVWLHNQHFVFMESHFAAIDKDEDQQISFHELMEFCGFEGLQPVSWSQLQKIDGLDGLIKLLKQPEFWAFLIILVDWQPWVYILTVARIIYDPSVKEQKPLYSCFDLCTVVVYLSTNLFLPVLLLSWEWCYAAWFVDYAKCDPSGVLKLRLPFALFAMALLKAASSVCGLIVACNKTAFSVESQVRRFMNRWYNIIHNRCQAGRVASVVIWMACGIVCLGIWLMYVRPIQDRAQPCFREFPLLDFTRQVITNMLDWYFIFTILGMMLSIAAVFLRLVPDDRQREELEDDPISEVGEQCWLTGTTCSGLVSTYQEEARLFSI